MASKIIIIASQISQYPALNDMAALTIIIKIVSCLQFSLLIQE